MKDIIFDEEGKPISRKEWTGIDVENDSTGLKVHNKIKKVVINLDGDSAIHFEAYASKEAKDKGKNKIEDYLVQVPKSSIDNLIKMIEQEAYKILLENTPIDKEYFNEIPLTEEEKSDIINMMPEQPEKL